MNSSKNKTPAQTLQGMLPGEFSPVLTVRIIQEPMKRAQ